MIFWNPFPVLILISLSLGSTSMVWDSAAVVTANSRNCSLIVLWITSSMVVAPAVMAIRIQLKTNAIRIIDFMILI